jgi:ubiquinone biosynthesis protein
VMEEGVATYLDPDINMWESAEPFLKEWLRSELGPEAYYADRIVDAVRALKKLPHLIDKIDALYPEPGAAPPAPPLAEIAVLQPRRSLGVAATILLSIATGAALALAATTIF